MGEERWGGECLFEFFKGFSCCRWPGKSFGPTLENTAEWVELKLLMNWQWKSVNPSKCWSFLIIVGVGQFWIALTFPSSIPMSLLLAKEPRKYTEDWWKEHFSALRKMLYSLRHCRTPATCWRCSVMLREYTRSHQCRPTRTCGGNPGASYA